MFWTQLRWTDDKTGRIDALETMKSFPTLQISFASITTLKVSFYLPSFGWHTPVEWLAYQGTHLHCHPHLHLHLFLIFRDPGRGQQTHILPCLQRCREYSCWILKGALFWAQKVKTQLLLTYHPPVRNQFPGTEGEEAHGLPRRGILDMCWFGASKYLFCFTRFELECIYDIMIIMTCLRT